MKYEIKVTQINDDGSREPFFFDDKETVGQLAHDIAAGSSEEAKDAAK